MALPYDERERRARVWASILLPALGLGVLGWSNRWMSDDGFINLRITQNLLDGHGPVFNVGERVEAYTSPAWVLLLALFDRVTFGLPLEWVAVSLGIALSSAGLAAGALGSARLSSRLSGSRGRILLPVGALVIVGLPPFWDYASSGLETGLAFAWLGASFLALVQHTLKDDAGLRSPLARATRSPPATAVFVGLGPLIRPDFAIFSLAFVAVVAYTAWPGRRWRALTTLVWAAVIPVAYQVFRMGYFAALVPNTALAKSADEARWHRGWTYFTNLAETYWLWVPILALGVLGASWLLGPDRRVDRGIALAIACPASAFAHALYVVRVGGDFMHARLLLPSVFTLLLPVMVVALRRRAIEFVTVAVISGWTAVAAIGLRYPQPETSSAIDNLREAFVRGTGNAHPVRAGDFRPLPFPWLVDGEQARRLAERTSVILAPRAGPGPLRVEGRPLASVEARVVTTFKAIGIAGYASGPNVHIVDVHGLADPVAARSEVTSTVKAGHEKELPNSWTLGRFADPRTLRLSPSASREVAAARRALSCGGLRDELRAIQEPLDAGRFVTNIRTAVRLRSLTVPRDPRDAEAAMCPPR